MPTRPPATYEDLKALPDDVLGQIVDGVLETSPRPTFGHTRAASVLTVKLGEPFDLGGRGGPGGWWILFEPGLHLGPDILVPDLAGWRRERMPHPPAPEEPFSTLAPDWVCEVLSPSTVRLDRVKKARAYGREGVRHLWLVDPLARTLEALRLEEGRWGVLGTWEDGESVRAEPFDALELELAALWLPEASPSRP